MQSTHTQDLTAASWADLSEHLRSGNVYALKWSREGRMQAIAGPYGTAKDALTLQFKPDWRTGPDLDWAVNEHWRQITILEEPEENERAYAELNSKTPH
ncbi:MAG: hypothetical protein JWO59_1720 [Chloroflexi bacterium]|jgi:hypothetical protein|nr:hypothetical protein [Chloroflexota bacterium]MDB5074348.1 hypothetical protein [Chloroflexota bacterium]